MIPGLIEPKKNEHTSTVCLRVCKNENCPCLLDRRNHCSQNSNYYRKEKKNKITHGKPKLALSI